MELAGWLRGLHDSCCQRMRKQAPMLAGKFAISNASGHRCIPLFDERTMCCCAHKPAPCATMIELTMGER